jgi:hypothetical protein
MTKEFGKLRLSVQGTSSGRGFDILYDFGKSMDFCEFSSKPEFSFIQPWMQFPLQDYTDECMRVSIELVQRFNTYDELVDGNARKDAEIARLRKELDLRNQRLSLSGFPPYILLDKTEMRLVVLERSFDGFLDVELAANEALYYRDNGCWSIVVTKSESGCLFVPADTPSKHLIGRPILPISEAEWRSQFEDGFPAPC